MMGEVPIYVENARGKTLVVNESSKLELMRPDTWPQVAPRRSKSESVTDTPTDGPTYRQTDGRMNGHALV